MNTTLRGFEMSHSARLNATLTRRWRKWIGAVCLVLTAAFALPAQSEQPSASTVKFKTLVNFDGINGALHCWPISGAGHGRKPLRNDFLRGTEVRSKPHRLRDGLQNDAYRHTYNGL